jgi:hypothetical protein
MKICVDEYAEAPEGVPVWCVEQEVSWLAGLELIIELVILILLFEGLRRLFTYLRKRKARKRLEREQLNKKEDVNFIWHP